MQTLKTVDVHAEVFADSVKPIVVLSISNDYFYLDVAIVVLVSGAGGMDTADRQRAAVEYCYQRRMAVMSSC